MTERVPAREILGSAWQTETRPESARFRNWTERYLAAAADQRNELISEGVALAQTRRAMLSALIKRNPREALAAAVPMTVRAHLPAEVVAELEQRISRTGDLSLLGITPAPGQVVTEPYAKFAAIDGETFRAYTYGRRDSQATKIATPIVGVAVDGALAVSESPLRVLEAGEVTPAETPVAAVCPISGKTTALASNTPFNAGTAVQVADQVLVLCHVDHVSEYEAQLIKAEDAAGPYPVNLILGDSGPGTSNITGRPPVSWSQGTKKVLIIRVDFSDKTGTPVVTGGSPTIDDTFAVNQITQTNGVRDFYVQDSYNKTTLSIAAVAAGDSPDVTPVYRLPKTATYYALGDSNDAFDLEMHLAAQDLATAGGYNLNTYDRIGVVFSNLGGIANSKITYGGRAEVQGKKFWINGYYNFGTLVHELGHTYGLQHSNLWKVTDGDPVSSNGTSLEYGDPFDPMGTNVITVANHFNHWEKSLLQWIPDTAVTTVSTAGTYRVYRFDHASANLANPLALKIVRSSAQDYWIGQRRGLSNFGAYVLWGYNAVQQSNLIDLNTPNSDPTDSPLAVGATFHDTAAGITINPIASGGSSPNEYLDVQISFDSRIQWSATTYNFDEKLGPGTLTLQRSGSSIGSISVNYATSNGSAATPADYASTSGTITWANGDSSPKTISVPIVADSSAEGTENFTLTLSGATSGAVIVGGATATVNIADAGAADSGLTSDFIDSSVKQVIMQPDGKALIAGWFGHVYVNFIDNPRGGFARLNVDGTLDTTFGAGAGANVLPVQAMALQTDGKVLIGGAFTSVHGVGRTRVARLNADGSLDTSFDPGTGPNNEVHSLAIQADGKILIGGTFTAVNGQARVGIARLNVSGSLDTSFTGPSFYTAFSTADITSIALQPDNLPLIGGFFYFADTAPTYRCGLARLNTNGALDGSFSPGYGAHKDGDTSALYTVYKVAVQRDGKILVGGDFTGFGGVTHNRLARLNSNGSLDGTFSPAIDPTIPTTASPRPTVQTIFVQPDSRIFIGGSFAKVGTTTQSNFARLNSDGGLDTTFAVGSGSTGWVYDSTMHADGKLFFGGDFATIQGTAQRTIARLFTGIPGLPGTIQFSASAYIGSEGNSLAVTAMRVGGSYGAISVNYATIPGTATASDFTSSAATLTWIAGDVSSRTITIPIAGDAVAESDETFTLNLAIPIGTFLGSPGLATVTATTAFNAWRYNNFTATELADSAISSDSADPNYNGIPNLIEYASGANPKAAVLTHTPTTTIQNIGGSNYLTLSFHKVPTAVDLIYTPQSGASLGTWNGSPVVTGSTISNPDGTQTVTYRDSVPITPSVPLRFMRLQVTRTP